jgi:hypothetical protein
MCKPGKNNGGPVAIQGHGLPLITDQRLLELAQARGLAGLREIAVQGRAFAVENTCPWTARLLKKLGCFEATVAALCLAGGAAASLESAGEQFLFRMSASPEPLVFAMARLELALMRVRQGSPDEYLVEWDRNPELVFQSLRSGGDLPPAEPEQRYRAYVSRDIPELVRCERTGSGTSMSVSA